MCRTCVRTLVAMGMKDRVVSRDSRQGCRMPGSCIRAARRLAAPIEQRGRARLLDGRDDEVAPGEQAVDLEVGDEVAELALQGLLGQALEARQHLPVAAL